MCTYHATKGYVLLLGEAISYELRNTNVKLLTLCPGPFLSQFVKKAHNDYTFSKIKPISSDEVAEFGYKKSLKGKSLAIVGFKNRITILASKFAPRKLVTSSSAKTMKKE
jgi:short-subunit dehydrogenase